MSEPPAVTTRVKAQGSTSTTTIPAFRLVDPGSARPVEVELRGRTLAGTVRDGDWVEVAGDPGQSGRLEVARVSNLTTSSEVTAIGSPTTAGAKAFTIVFSVVFLAIAITIIIVIMRGFLGTDGF